ncbi:RNA-directed DNA polymerase, eukaryota, reverse transcriptase zinc-binding domain protein [Tanacetum coccineum]
MFHLEGKLFESLGCLVLVRRDCIGSSKFTIYEMMKGCSVWSSKYTVNTDDFKNPLLKGWSIRSIVWSIVLGEREDDSFLIINLSAKVVQYNLISKTLREIYDMGSNEIVDDYLHGFISPYDMYDVGYKKLNYKFVIISLEGGPWMVRNSPIILKKWFSLHKEELTRIPIWVKLHDVPIQVFKEDGISLITTYLGKPIMLDSYTSSMCKDSWGSNSFARCLIKINSEVVFMESIIIGIPDLEGPVVNKKRNNKRSSAGNKLPKEVPVAKGFQVGKDFQYQPRAPSDGSNGGGNRSEASSKAGSSKDANVGSSVTTKGNSSDRKQDKDVVDIGMIKMSNITTPNPFAALDNYYVDRRALWNILTAHASLMRDKPWALLGDFNVALNLEDHSCGGYEPNIAMRDFKECVQKMEVVDVNAIGLYFTWNQKMKGSNGVGIKSLLNAASTTAAHIRVNATQLC